MADARKKRTPLPTKQQILEFIRESPTPVGKREIARAFHVTGADRIPLKAMLKELEREGRVDRGRKRRVAAPGALPPVAVVQITGTDPDGEVLARPAIWKSDTEPPRIYMAPDRPGTPALASGDRVLARLAKIEDNVYEGRTIRRLAGAPKRVLGIYERGPDGGGRLRPTDRRVKTDFRVDRDDANGARPGELVLAEVLHTHRLGWHQARVVERLGRLGEARSVSLISLYEHDIPTEFPPEAVAQAEASEPVALGDRTDLRDLPLVTIDGEDARDFDDAVWAAPDGDPRNPGGWRIVVAIADVAYYVRPGDALDRCAYERGNSVYFPDRVVPMLPEALSNGLCSLKPDEERPCMAVEMIIDARGRKRRHRFLRGLMRSAARLTYEQVQRARDGARDEVTDPLRERVIAPLYGAFAALLEARERRGTLELDIPERKVILGEDGTVERIARRPRLDSHRLIEEFMIAANVAAAETLEAKRQPAMYRIHDAPDPAKVEALRQFVATLGLPLARGQVIRPRTFSQLLDRAASTPYAAMINELVLRSQSQAAYSPENIGHFGLALPRYCHFTSPIRRYADLLVHRALVSGNRLGEGGLPPEAGAAFPEIGAHISATERRAASAERDAVDRFTAAFLADRVGAIFHGRIGGVTRFGLFVTLFDSGADGLVPIGTLPTDFYDHDESRHALVGRRRGRVYRLGETVEVRLIEAEPVTGGLILQLIEDEVTPAADRAEGAETLRRRGPGGKARARRETAPAKKGNAKTRGRKDRQGKADGGGRRKPSRPAPGKKPPRRRGS